MTVSLQISQGKYSNPYCYTFCFIEAEKLFIGLSRAMNSPVIKELKKEKKKHLGAFSGVIFAVISSLLRVGYQYCPYAKTFCEQDIAVYCFLPHSFKCFYRFVGLLLVSNSRCSSHFETILCSNVHGFLE